MEKKMNNFQNACELSLNDWVSTLPDIVPEAEYTKKHEKWKKNLFYWGQLLTFAFVSASRRVGGMF